MKRKETLNNFSAEYKIQQLQEQQQQQHTEKKSVPNAVKNSLHSSSLVKSHIRPQ
jgi:hypothetical protein